MAQNKTTTSKPTVSGGSKRKLDFDDGSRTLKNKTFFLDLKGYRNQDQLERELTRRGGLVEKFFDVGVKYLVTNRSHDDSSTPSPRPISTGKSPLESVSPVEPGKKPAYLTRAAMMVAASKKISGSKKNVDLIAMAKSWGCKVISLDALLAELKRLKPLPKKGGKIKASCGVVHHLRAPYLKVEDQSRGYKPLVHEPKVWPRPQHNTSPNSCPFDAPKTKPPYCSGSPRSSPDRPRSFHPMITRSKKPGYCECCSQRYEDLPMHLRSGKHSEYANDDSNYATLDKLISRGEKYADFVRKLKRSPLRSYPKNLQKDDSVVLKTPPNKRQKSPRQPEVSSPRKKITLGTFASPKTGQLRITPVKTDKEQTPGFVTPKETKTEAVAQEAARTLVASNKRCLYTEGEASERPCCDTRTLVASRRRCLHSEERGEASERPCCETRTPVASRKRCLHTEKGREASKRPCYDDIRTSRKRCLDTDEEGEASERPCCDSDCVPETPVKRVRKSSPCDQLLTNLNTIFVRRRGTSAPTNRESPSRTTKHL